MCPVVLLDHANVVRPKTDIDDRSAGASALALLPLPFTLPWPLLSALIVARQIQQNKVIMRPIQQVYSPGEAGTIDGEPAASAEFLNSEN